MSPELLCVSLAALMFDSAMGHKIPNQIRMGGEAGWSSGFQYPKVNMLENDVLIFDFTVSHDVYLLKNPSCDFSETNAERLAGNFQSPFVWVADEPGTYYFGCSTGGHCQSGQIAEVEVHRDMDEHTEDQDLPFCKAARCNLDELGIPAGTKPTELRGLLVPAKNEACKDAVGEVCRQFMNNMFACGVADRDGTDPKLASYVSQFARGFAGEVMRSIPSGAPADTPTAGPVDPAVKCPGMSVVRMMGNAEFGAEPGQCSEMCMPTMAVAFLPNAEEGACSDAGYPTMNRAMMVSMQGRETEVTVYDEAGEGPKCPGMVLVRMMGNADYGAEPGQCSEMCAPGAAVAFFPNAEEGACAEVGFSKVNRVETMAMQGWDVDVTIHDEDDSAQALECAEGTVVARVLGNADMGATADQCTEFCTAPRAVTFIPSAAQGPCSDDGLTEFVTTTEGVVGGWEMEMFVYAAPAAPTLPCPEGSVVAHVVGSEEYGASPVQCSTFCIPSMAMAFIAGSAKGPCSEKGFSQHLESKTVEAGGWPMEVHISVGGEVGEGGGAPEGCEFEPRDDGRTQITCYSDALPMYPGKVIDSTFKIPNPYPKDRAVAMYQRGSWIVNADKEEVPLSEVYIHHMGSSIVAGVGSDFRGMEDPLPAPFYEYFDGATIPSFSNMHLISTLGVADEDVLPCVECWCERGSEDLDFTGLGELSGTECCLDCPTSAGTEDRDYHLKFTIVYEELRPEMRFVTDVWYDILPGRIEYDVPKAAPGAIPVHTLEFVTEIDYTAPRTEPFALVRCSAHMHIGAIGMWVYDAETGEELCQMKAIHGTGDKDDMGNEGGYLVKVTQTTLEEPRMFEPGHRVRLVSKYNSDIYHGGVMALAWLDLEGSSDQEISGFFTQKSVGDCPTEDAADDNDQEDLSLPVRSLHGFQRRPTALSVMWAAPEASGVCQAETVRYLVSYKRSAGKGRRAWKKAVVDNTPDTVVHLNGLSPNQSYTIKVTPVYIKTDQVGPPTMIQVKTTRGKVNQKASSSTP